MSNPLFKVSQAQQPKQQQHPDIKQLYADFKNNPLQYLTKAKLNIPAEIGNDPENIGRYLMQSGQINNGLLARIKQLMPNFKGIF